MFLGIANAISGIKSGGLSFIKDNLKLYLDFKSNKSDTLKFPSEGSTSFDGSDDFIQIGALGDLGTDCTITVWVNRSTTSGSQYLFDARGASNGGTGFAYFPTGSTTFNATSGTKYVDGVVGSTVGADGWHFIAIKGMTLNVNEDLKIGSRLNTNEFFNGKMANFAIWSRALEPEEIQSIMNKSYSQLKGVEKTSLVAWWALDDIFLGKTTNVNDIVTSNYIVAKIIENKASSISDNLIPDGEFETGISNFSATGNGVLSYNSDKNLVITGSGGTGTAILDIITLEVNTEYIFEIAFAGGTDDSINVRLDQAVYGGINYGNFYTNTSQGTNSSPKKVSVKFTSHSSLTEFYLRISNINDTKTAIISSVKLFKASGYGASIGATTTTSVYGGNAPILPRAVDLAKEGQADAIGDGSALFNGSTDYIDLGDTDLFSFGNSSSDHAFSISAWINMVDATSFHIATKGIYNSNAEWVFETDTADRLRLGFFDESVNSTYEIGLAPAMTSYQNEWVHVCATYDGRGGTDALDGVKIYYNGISQSMSSSFDSGTYVAMENLDANVHIGRYDTAYADGSISQLGIWKGELTQAQIQSVMESTSYSKIPADVKSTLGEEIALDGGFDTDVSAGGSSDNWTLGSSGMIHEISNGRYRYTDSATAILRLKQGGSNKTLTLNKTHKLTFEIFDNSAYITFVTSGETLIGNTLYPVGTHTVYFTPTVSHTRFDIKPSSISSSFSMDNLSLKEVTNDIVAYYPLDGSSSANGVTQDVTTGEVLGDELITKSVTDTWTGTGVTVNEASTEQVFSGTHSLKFVTSSDAGAKGVTSNSFTSVLNALYKIDFYVYTTDSDIEILVYQGDGSGTSITETITVTPNQWVNVVRYYNEEAGGASSSLRFYNNTSGVTAYIDNISLKRVTSNTGVLK